MTTYARKVKTETRNNCKRAVERLEQEIEQEISAHNAKLSNLQTRLADCKEMIAQITTELDQP